jgi:ABC-2 type transport system ATP-binding protein
VHVARVGAHTLRLEVTGEVGSLLRALAPFDVVALESREPSLEEIFQHHYSGDAG